MGSFFVSSLGSFGEKRLQEFRKLDARDTDDTIGSAVIGNKCIVTDDSTTGEDNIRDNTEALITFLWAEEGAAAASDDFLGVLQVEEDGTDPVVTVIF